VSNQGQSGGILPSGFRRQRQWNGREFVIVNCQFLENMTFESLISPVGKQEFLSRYHMKQPMIVHRNDPNFYGDLYSVEEFDATIMRDPEYVKLANNVSKKNLSYKSASVPGLEMTIADLREGGTLVLDQMNKKDNKVGELARILGKEFSHNFQVNMYLTPPRGRGFGAHWDNHDVFILQVEGSKKWSIEKERRAIPKKVESMGDDGRELQGELHTFTLNQGDLIYIPRGFVHAAECGAEHSLHLTVGVSGVYWEDLLQGVVAAITTRDPEMREILPFHFMEGGREKLLNGLKKVVREIQDEKFLAEIVDEFMDACIKQYRMDVSGQVTEFLKPLALQITDVVGPRRGTVYRIHPGEDSIRLLVGTRNIAFLDIFKEALGYAMTTPSFAIGELPGDLEDVERIVFIERLIQEGLIVRK
jgi:ribosomal protein L16 Arg81 hydroxylase